MSRCDKILSHGKGSDGQPIVRTVAFRCELDTDHEGPCASPSDRASVDRRKKWEKDEQERIAQERHTALGLGMSQSRPLSSGSILQYSQAPHSSSETDCPFCGESVMWKDISTHLGTAHPSAPEVVHLAAESKKQEPPSSVLPDVFSVDDCVELIDAWLALLPEGQDAVLEDWALIKAFIKPSVFPALAFDNVNRVVANGPPVAPALLLRAWNQLFTYLQNRHYVLHYVLMPVEGD